MYEIIKNILFLILGIGITILGFYMIYLKLLKKDSWLYKESEGVHWMYALTSMRTWGLILGLSFMGMGLFLHFLEKLISLL